MEEKEILTLSPYDNFVYALKAEATKRQYPNRLDRFLSFIGLEGSIQEKCSALYEISKNKEVLYSHLIRFINSQNEYWLSNALKWIETSDSNDIVDGKSIWQFIQNVKQWVENPDRLGMTK